MLANLLPRLAYREAAYQASAGTFALCMPEQALSYEATVLALHHWTQCGHLVEQGSGKHSHGCSFFFYQGIEGK